MGPILFLSCQACHILSTFYTMFSISELAYGMDAGSDCKGCSVGVSELIKYEVLSNFCGCIPCKPSKVVNFYVLVILN